MKHTTAIQKLTSALLRSMMILGGCSATEANNTGNTESVPVLAVEAAVSEEYSADTGTEARTESAITTEEVAADEISASSDDSSLQEEDKEDAETIGYEYEVNKDTETFLQQTIPWTKSFAVNDIPAWNGVDPYAVINDNNPFFPEDCYTETSFETYPELDELGRCQSVCANIGTDLMPTKERSSISEVTPSGWNQKEYPDTVPGGWLMNRCHLIGYQLCDEGANKNNLISGTKYLNNYGMLPFENMVADYIKETDNHVLYRSTPVFEGDNLLASGVLLEARSIEDDGEGICFCAYCWNVQPGIAIDYLTGNSWAANTENGLEEETEDAKEAEEADISAAEYESDFCSGNTGTQDCCYVLNTSTHKIHDPDCGSAATMAEENKEYSDSTLEELLEDGYSLCSRCLGK